MADSTIGGLPLAPQIDADSLLAVEQQGQARRMTGAQFAQFARDSVAGFTDTAKEYAQQAAASAGDYVYYHRSRIIVCGAVFVGRRIIVTRQHHG